ncbi:hypothetical protein DFJ63DRAFT_311509 [Scheffersomyces coipomensis]|uniref:uncharacterized protein n=1 Tax=Scheffersomyces coipomensis TaxID=1788519 RepID=UPI00315D55E5
MLYDGEFLTNYFLLFPNDIIIRIFHLLSNELVECLMNTNAFQTPVYYEFLKDIIIYKPKPKKPMRMGSMCGASYEPFMEKPPTLALNNLPSNFIPRSIHIQGNIKEVKAYLSQNSNFINTIKDIRISLRMDLRPIPRVGVPPSIIQLQNLTLLEIAFHLKPCQYLIIPFNINNKTDVLDLKNIARKMGKPRIFSDIFDRIPLNTSVLKLLYMDEFPRIANLNNLKSLSLLRCDTSEFINTLPKSLEKVWIKYGRFPDHQIVWPPNLKSIHLEGVASYNTSIIFTNWPNTLKSLTLKNNSFNNHDVSNLPGCLEYLELENDSYWRKCTFILQSDESGHHTFPESLIHMKLSKVEFPEEPNTILDFPKNLKRLELLKSSLRLEDCIFPESLEYLDLIGNKIDNIISYNNPSLNTDWQHLIHLRHLSLENNSLTQSSLMDWLPPRNLNYLDLQDNNIHDLNISLFKKTSKGFTHNLLKIDLYNNEISNIPCDFYLPDNLCEFFIRYSSFPSRFFPIVIRGKRVTEVFHRGIL